MKDEKIVEKVVTVSLVPDLPVGTVFIFDGKKQKYEVTPREYDILCKGCVFQWDKLERDTPARTAEKNAESFAAELQNAKTREDVKQILTDAEAFVSRGILSAEKLVEIQHAADALVEEKKL